MKRTKQTTELDNAIFKDIGLVIETKDEKITIKNIEKIIVYSHIVSILLNNGNNLYVLKGGNGLNKIEVTQIITKGGKDNENV